jgi:two-component system chemotaxis response regulator CheB
LAHERIVVIGGSAGSIEVVLDVISALPADFPAAILIVIHVPIAPVSKLPVILERAGRLPVRHARSGDSIERGRVYVAPADLHMLVREGWIELQRGPRENHSRPAIDPTMRSAGRSYGPDAIGVILSGALYDGAGGLLTLKTHGGIAIVQDPEDAITTSMPRSAIALVDVDHIVPAAEIAPLLDSLVRAPRDREEVSLVDEEARAQATIDRDFADQAAGRNGGESTPYSCPDCGGVLWQLDGGSGFQCHVGHAYATEALLVQKSEELENALWACLRLLREKSTLSRQTAERAFSSGNDEVATRIREQAELEERHGAVIRELLETTAVPAIEV